MKRLFPLWLCLLYAHGGYSQEAQLKMNFLFFQNMENGWHITDRGNKVLLTDQMGQVIAYGDMSPRLVFTARGVPMPAGYYTQATELTVPLKVFRATSSHGRGRIKICIPYDPYASPDRLSCRKLGNNLGGDDPVTGQNGLPIHRHWQFDHEVDYQISGQTVKIERWYGINDYESLGPNVQSGFSLTSTGMAGVLAPAVSGAHPISSAAAQKKGTKKDFQSPLVLDLKGKGSFQLLDAWNETQAVYFDMEGQGVKHRTGWVASDEGLLFIDRNGDGQVSDGRELFSEYSYGFHLEEQSQRRFANGFDALAQYDHNHDNVIDGKDPAFKFLRVWMDENQNGLSEVHEIKTLKELKIAAISLFYTEKSEPLHTSGNEIRLLGHYILEDGSMRTMADVWFRTRRESQWVGP